MADMDKILQALERLENGQNSLRGDVKSLHATVDQQGKAIAALQEGQETLKTDVKSLREGQNSLIERQTTSELKMEAFHAYQKQAHEETTKLLLNIIEIDGQEQITIKKQVDRIEKHLDLPPLK